MIQDKKFRQWLDSQKSRERSLQHLWEVYQKEFPEIGIQKSSGRDFLQAEIECMALRLGNWPEWDKKDIIVYISLSYVKRSYLKKGEKILFRDGKIHKVSLGKYRLFFNLNGEIERDEFERY